MQRNKILLVVYYEADVVPSIKTDIAFFRENSKCSVEVLNLFYTSIYDETLKVSLSSYHALVIHNTVSYSPDTLWTFNSRVVGGIDRYVGKKIILKQDEHYRFSEFCAFCDQVGINTIFTVMPKSEWSKTYGDKLNSVDLVPMLTGYVNPTLHDIWKNRSLHRKVIDIGYRGSKMPLSFGSLCYEKQFIGEIAKFILRNNNIRMDVSSESEDRLNGKDWFDFLCSCKVVLGVESGTDVFDLDGDLEKFCLEIEKSLGEDDGSIIYAKKYLKLLQPKENLVSYKTISPRHFEAIASGAAQALKSGDYSGIMVPNEHYFEIAEDYSNIHEVAELVSDESKLQKLTSVAYKDILLNPEYSINAFVSNIDKVIGHAPFKKLSTSSDKYNVLQLQAEDHGSDPRRDYWYRNGATADLRYINVGIDTKNASKGMPSWSHNNITLPMYNSYPDNFIDILSKSVVDDIGATLALREILYLCEVSKYSDTRLVSLYDIENPLRDVPQYRWWFNYLINTFFSLVFGNQEVKGVHCVQSINVATLAPGLVIRALTGASLVYESLEYWPEADPMACEGIKNFWRRYESRLIKYCDRVGTVSPQIAAVMSEKYGVKVSYVPNSPPLEEAKKVNKKKGNRTKPPTYETYFVFQGAFAPNRCLDELIRAWPHVASSAILCLRGFANEERDKLNKLVSDLKLRGRVKFLPPVDQEHLVQALAEVADVSIIPYGKLGVNYSNCSPNKLGQSLCAGIPLLCNKTNFVEAVVEEADCGLVVDFSNQPALISAVNALMDMQLRQRFAINAIDFFKKSFCWDVLSKSMYRDIVNLVSDQPKAAFQWTATLNSPSNVDGGIVNPVYDKLKAEFNLAPTLNPPSITYRVVVKVWTLLPGRIKGMVRLPTQTKYKILRMLEILLPASIISAVIVVSFGWLFFQLVS